MTHITESYGITLLNVELENNILKQFMYRNEVDEFVYYSNNECKTSKELPSLNSYDYSFIQKVIDDEMRGILEDNNVPNDGRNLMNYLLDNDLINILKPFEYKGKTYYTKADYKDGRTIFYAGDSDDEGNFNATHYRYNGQWYEFEYPINLATFDSWDSFESGLSNNPPVVNYEVFTGTTIQINATPIDDFDDPYYNAMINK